MKKIIYAILFAMLPALAFIGCTNDDEVTAGGVKKYLSFVATSDGSGQKSNASERMKTQLHPDKGNSVTFSSNDAISVFDGVGNNQFTTTSSGASVTFEGTATESSTYTALYPYQSNATMSGQTITATLPTTQTAQNLTYDPQAALSVATTTQASKTFDFKNVCALVKFTTVEPLAKIVFKGNNSEKVAGAVNIAVSDAPTATGDAESVTIVPASPATSIAAGTYYIAVLPLKFTQGFTLEAYKTAGSAATASYVFSKHSLITLTRSRILNIGEFSATTSVDDNNHAYVDLDIEVNGYKILWATMNVGASKEWENGDYFAWGETEPKTNYAWETYKWVFGTYNDLIKYCHSDIRGLNGFTDTLVQLELSDDAARQNWRGDWVMPTLEEWEALCKNTKNEWVENYKGKGVNGFVFTSKTNSSKSIFLPAAGSIDNTTLSDVARYGFYWTSSISYPNPDDAYSMMFDLYDYIHEGAAESRYRGQPIRPILRFPTSH